MQNHAAGRRALALIAACLTGWLKTSIQSLPLLGLALLLGAIFPAQAQHVRYDVAIDISSPEEDAKPRELETLLRDNLDIVRWRDHPAVDLDQLQRLYRGAPQQITELLTTEGFYSPRVDASIVEQGGGWAVSFRIDTGPAVKVASIEIDITGEISEADAAALRAQWSLKTGEIFRQGEWEQAKRNLLRQAVRERTPRAQLQETSATVDPAQLTAALKVGLDTGAQVRFGDTSIEGLSRYPASRVTNLNPIKPGQPYSEAALQTLQTRLQETGYFSGVEVYADLDTPAAGEPVPVKIRVTENKRKRLGVGIGYSTNTGNRAQLSYDDLSVFGLRFKSALTLETRRQSGRGEFFFPVTQKGYNDSIAANLERTDINNEITRLASLAGRRTWGAPTLERSLTLEYVNESKRVVGGDESHSRALPLTYGITFRRTDNQLFPTEGYLLNTQLGVAPLPLLTDRQFLRGYLRGVLYNRLGSNKAILILRGEAGVVAARDRDGIPSTYLFRAGGDQSVRGYAYQELGVREGAAVVGGRYLRVASVETQYWFLPEWGGAAFIDAGNAADRVSDLKPKVGYGVGARWKSPVGPVNLDVAYGRAVKQVRLHFSLGFIF